MRPLTNDCPKPLVSIAGRPLLVHILESLPPEVDSLVVVVKYLGDQIRACLGTTFRDVPITYIEQDAPDGTGGAVWATRAVLADRFMVLPADDLHGREALCELVRHERAILVARSETPERFGVLTLHHDGTLAGIEEKPEHPATNLVNTSVMVLDRNVLAYDAPLHGEELYLTDLVTQLAVDFPIAVVTQDAWCPVGCPEDIPRAEAFLRERGM